MSRANVEIVRRCNRVWSDRDWSAIPELFDPEFELDLSRNVFNPDVYHGHPGIERWASAVEDMWDDFQWEVTEVIEAGDNVVSANTIRGQGKESGVRAEMRVFSVWTFRDSKVVRVVGGYRDRVEALAAAGLETNAGGELRRP
jgi:ketosteroid isomerase-like protein